MSLEIEWNGKSDWRYGLHPSTRIPIDIQTDTKQASAIQKIQTSLQVSVFF